MSTYTPTAHDPSDAMPAGGYVAPLMPQGWLAGKPVATAVLGAQDAAHEGARLDLGRLRYAHTWRYAVGQDLDDLSAIVGVGRLTGEPDDGPGGGYRARIAASAGQPNTTTAPGMQAWLQGFTGLSVVVRDDATPGFASVTFVGYPALGLLLVPEILRRKPVGAQLTINAQSPTAGQHAIVGGFVVGTDVVGGINSYVTLYRPAITSQTGSISGKFVVGTTTV
jgi:hypothetical protein